MHSKTIFGHLKWPPAAILFKKNKVAYLSEMARNVIKSDFQSSKMDAGSNVAKVIFGHPKWGGGGGGHHNANHSGIYTVPLGKYTNSSFIILLVANMHQTISRVHSSQ